MAKERITKAAVRLTQEQILHLTPLQMKRTSTKQLRVNTQQLMDVARKRVQRLMKDDYGKYSPAVRDFVEAFGVDSKGNINLSTKTLEGKTRAQVKNTFNAVRKFLRDETSTVRGMKKNVSTVEKRLGTKFASGFDYDLFWRAYHSCERSWGGFAKGESTEAQLLVRRMTDDSPATDIQEFIKEFMRRFQDIYEEQARNEWDMYEEFYRGSEDEEGLDT